MKESISRTVDKLIHNLDHHRELTTIEKTYFLLFIMIALVSLIIIIAR